MQFDIVTIFPDLFSAFLRQGVLGRAVDDGLVRIAVHDLRAWSGNRWGQVDDEPYGGGAGMVLRAAPVLAAVRQLRADETEPGRVMALSPRGRVFDQLMAEELAARERRLILLCGRYEGIDERAVEILGAEEVSLGDFILGGGEVAAMAIVEAVSRLVPGVVGDPESVVRDSFSTGLLDHPCYTRPATVEGQDVPSVLLSGNHEAIRRWRLERAVRLTVTRRPDLLRKSWALLSAQVRDLVAQIEPALARECDSESGRPRA
jgi:tRNA (guanine37-N1)-methyltransferase